MTASTAQFTTRARVVDLLGREQIADAPTAMGELFKNAIDAAASKVRIDYWQKEKCLVISDDGLGMRTEEELIAKWLVIATDSKHQRMGATSDWMKFADIEQRARLSTGKAFGQKGIGRLAMALLGSGTLVWTRWGHGSEIQRTLMLVPWNIFRHPKLTLDQIELPMVMLDRAATKEDALQLVQQAQSWIASTPQFQSSKFEHLPLLATDLESDFARSLQAPIEFPDTPGTQFIVLNTDETVANHFEGWLGKEDLFGEDDAISPEGPKAYLAFNNPFIEGKPRLEIELWCDGKLSKGNTRSFWSRQDFKKADHFVSVEIDAEGFARGIARRFDEEISYERQLPRLPASARSPGPLRIEVGEIEGDLKNSKLPDDQWILYYRRLNDFGGFYVYMDDVRVCPYGRDDSDFVGFEKRRNLNAGRHFWSHPRMFGGVFLRAELNPNLFEKAGREGFQQNGAYRGLVHYLKSLFVDLADSYYGTKAKRPDKQDRKKEKERQEREERHERERADFLDKFALSKKALETIETTFRKHSQKLEKQIADAELALAPLLLEGCRADLTKLRLYFQRMWEGMVSQFPSEFSLEPDDGEAVDHYLHRRGEIDLYAQQLLTQLASRLDRLASKHEDASFRRSTGKRILQDARQDFDRLLKNAVVPVMEAEKRLQETIAARPERDLIHLDGIANEVLAQSVAELENGDNAIVEEVVARQTRELQEKSLPFYERVRSQITLLVEGDGGLIEAADLREELRLLKDRERHLLELAQLGLVMESADHDYRSMLADAETAIESLSRVIPQSSQQSLQNLKDAFQHIDEQLQAWDPLV